MINTIQCPKCRHIFEPNETAYNQLVSQVRGAEFDREVYERLERETALLREKAKGDLANRLAEKDLELERLQTKLEQARQNVELEISSALVDKEKETIQLRNQVENLKQQQALELKESLSEKDLEIERLRTQLEQVKESVDLEIVSAMSQKDLELEQLQSQLTVITKQQELDVQALLTEKNLEVERLKAQLEQAREKTELEISSAMAQKDREIEGLQAKLEALGKQQALEVQAALNQQEVVLTKVLGEKDLELQTLRQALEAKEQERELALATTRQEYELQLKLAEDQVALYKNFKAQQSTKAIGESLEAYAETEFNKVRSYAFPRAQFGKDNLVSDRGSKGDFIFREADENGVEFISIMFEMKNEADTTKTKHKNADFFKELDKDRREKGCEYAVLVSMLEADNDYYNTGIVDVSHAYPKMYVVRPQFFIQLIGLLRNAALNSLQYKQELALIKSQNIDITNFEEDLETFKQAFAKNYNSASSNFKKAIDEIDKSIKRMEEVKRFLTTSENQLRLANNKLDDVSVKKLTRKNPTMKAKFENLKTEQ